LAGDWMKEVDDTPVPESESVWCAHAELLAQHVNEVNDQLREWAKVCEARIVALEHALALLNEERVTVRAPEATDDPEWF